ncbi:tetratricopeptide repeat protein [Chitinophagaceae bacterium MMS25-I14]
MKNSRIFYIGHLFFAIMLLCAVQVHAQSGSWYDSMERLKTPQEKIAFLTRNISAEGPSGSKYENRGYYRAISGDQRGALEDYTLALKYTPNEPRVFYDRGLAYCNLKKNTLAYSDLSMAISLDSAYESAWADRGALLCAMEKYEDALHDLDKALLLNADNYNAMYNKGYTLIQLKRYKEALTVFEAAAPLLTSFADEKTIGKLWFYKGVALRQTGKPEDAVDCYNKAIQHYKGDYTYFLDRARTLGDLHRDREAIADYDYLTLTYPRHGDVFYERGTLMLERKRWNDALDDFNTATDDGYTTSDVYNNRGHARSELGDRKGALKDYELAIEKDTLFYSAYLNRAALLDDMDDSAAALDAYNALVHMAPDSAESYYNRGNLKVKMKRYESALKDYNKAIERNPGMYDSYINRGNVRKELSDLAGAEDDYTKATVLAPDQPLAYLQRGRIRKDRQDNPDAFSDLTRAVALDTGREFPQAYMELAITEQQSDMPDEALKHYRIFLEYYPRSSLAYNNMAYISFDKNDLEEAHRLFGESLRINKKGVDALLGLAMTCFMMDRKEEAAEALHKATRIFPPLKNGMAGIEELKKNGFFYTGSQERIMKKIFDQMK